MKKPTTPEERKEWLEQYGQFFDGECFTTRLLADYDRLEKELEALRARVAGGRGKGEHMRTREEEREERRRFEADVYYEAWRQGRDPDRYSECAEDCYYDGKSPQECVADTAERERSMRAALVEWPYEREAREQERELEESP